MSKATISNRVLPVFLIGGLTAGFFSIPVEAQDDSYDLYLESLKIADRHVQKQKSVSDRAGALSTSMLRSLYGKYYKIGETWKVAALRSDSTMARKVSDAEQLQPRADRVIILQYEVVDMKNGPNPRAVVEVTQLNEEGYPIVDASVEKIILTIDDQLAESTAKYIFKDTKKTASSLELFPIEVPTLATADQLTRTAAPDLPSALKGVASKHGYNPKLSQSSWFEEDDAFGRAVKILWQHGDPWPAYLKTSNGVSILLSK